MDLHGKIIFIGHWSIFEMHLAYFLVIEKPKVEKDDIHVTNIGRIPIFTLKSILRRTESAPMKMDEFAIKR